MKERCRIEGGVQIGSQKMAFQLPQQAYRIVHAG